MDTQDLLPQEHQLRRRWRQDSAQEYVAGPRYVGPEEGAEHLRVHPTQLVRRELLQALHGRVQELPVGPTPLPDSSHGGGVEGSENRGVGLLDYTGIPGLHSLVSTETLPSIRVCSRVRTVTCLGIGEKTGQRSGHFTPT